MISQGVPAQLAQIIAAKNARRRELAALPWEDKIDIVQRMWALKEAPEKLLPKQNPSWTDVRADQPGPHLSPHNHVPRGL